MCQQQFVSYDSLLLLILVTLTLDTYTSTGYPAGNYRDLDICNHWNGRRHFLELGDRGDLHARNVTTTAFRSTLFSPVVTATATSGSASNGNAANGKNRNNTSSGTNNDIWYQCNLELVTCAECVIRITFTHANFSKTCATNGGVGKSSMCPCEHIQFSEPPYDTIQSGQEFCGDGKVFRSKTRTLMLKFFYRATNSHVFSLQYFSERNVKIVSGSPKQSIISSTNSKYVPEVISTPYFPMPYPRDYGIEHILTCEADNCQVRLDFTDFQLGLASTLEIFDSNGQMLDSYTGEHFRPPITISSGKSLLLQFRGNAATGVGFRAEVSFVSSKQLKEDRLVPYTDCGGMVSGPGGAITMMNMIENSTDVRFFDCIWIIKPGNNYMMMKTHIALRVEEFHGMASRSDLTIRQGTTSDAPEIESVVWPNNGMSKENHILPILTGGYLRLRGVFGMSSKLAVVYSVFNYLNCYIGSEFLCNNKHCISIRLHCDGFDHCGDGTDEPESCEEDWAHLQNDRRWYSHKPNYYFPKMEQYPDLKTATGIFIISTLGIFGVLSGWMVILYRMGVRARHQRELQNHLQTISELLDRQEDERTPDEPPSYEAPPDYEEVIKVGMEQELREPRRQRRHHRRNRDRSCSRAASNATVQSTLPLRRSSSCDRPTTSAAAMTHAVAATDTSQDAVAAANLQQLSNRMLLATALCGAAGSSCTAATKPKQSVNYNTVGISTSPPSLSSGCELSATFGDQQQQQQQPTNSSSPNEDCTDAFRDDSLNISLTLGIPTPTTPTKADTENNSLRPKSANNCTEHTYLKRSWIVVNNGTQNFKIQRLRHTFSSPEAFTTEVQPPYPDFLSYGTNLPHDRSFIQSNASNFGSELSRDPSSYSITKKQPKMPQQTLAVVSNVANDSSSTEVTLSTTDEPAAIAMATSVTTTQSYITVGTENQKEKLIVCDTDSDAENQISCFGAVNRRQNRLSNKIRNGHGGRRHVRSRSFTNTGVTSIGCGHSGHQQHTNRIMKRSSSADLLMNFCIGTDATTTIANASTVVVNASDSVASTSPSQRNSSEEPKVFLI